MTRTSLIQRRVKWLCAAPSILMVITIAVLGAYVFWFADGTADSASPTPTRDPDGPLYVAVGDSFISGEGAARYLAGTNAPGNSCHRANTGYPYLVAEAHSARLVNASCSGAVLADFWQAQYPHSPSTTYGGLPQFQAIATPRISPEGSEEAGPIDVVLLSVLGNDAGFGQIVRTCLDEDCLRYEPGWIRRLNALEPALEKFYPQIRAAARNARVLVIPYPEPFVVGDCVRGLSEPESRFLLQRFLPRLNQLIAWEAQIAGLEIVETRDAFAGARDCEPGVTRRTSAMNTLDLGRVGGSAADITRGSFHPRELGHQLLAKAVLDHLSRPAPDDPLGCKPFGCPPGPPPNPPVVPPGDRTLTFPPGSECFGRALISGPVQYLERRQERVAFETTPGTRVCYAFAGRPWDSITTGGDGTVSIPSEALGLGKTPALTVIHHASGASWTQLTFLAPMEVDAPEPWWWQRLSGWAVVIVAAFAGVALAPHLLEFALRRRRRRE